MDSKFSYGNGDDTMFWSDYTSKFWKLFLLQPVLVPRKYCI